MINEIISIAIYEIGKQMIAVKVERGTKVKDILVAAGKEVMKNGVAKRVMDVSKLNPQPYLDLDDKIFQDHSELFLGEHEFPEL